MRTTALVISILAGVLVLSIILGIMGNAKVETREVNLEKNPGTIYVGSGPGNDSTTIQGGIDLASTGDTVFVWGGTYYENVVIDKTLTLIGEDRDTTIIDGSWSSEVVYISADWVNISGFNMRYGEIGVHLYSSSNSTVTDCIACGDPYGISIDSSFGIWISNTFASGMTGIRLSSSSNTYIINCSTSYGNEGITIISSSNSTITNCTICGTLCGMYIKLSSDNNITYCDITNSSIYGLYVIEDSHNNWIYHNNLVNNDQNAYDECSNYWDNGSEGNYWSDYIDMDINNDGISEGVDNDGDWIGDNPYPIYGDGNQDNYPLMYPYPIGNPNKPKAYSSIQDPIEDATTGDTIYVWDGIYNENIVIDKTISLVGRDRNTTIIDGSGTGDVIYISADWVNVSGFGVRNGNKSSGMGISLNASYTRITNILAYNCGCGISLRESSYNIITNSMCYNNTWDGIYVSYLSDNNYISDCTLLNNNASGISIWYSSNNIIANCNLSNTKSGISVSTASNNTIMNSSSLSNDYGISISTSSNNYLLNSTFSSNDYGIYLSGSSNNSFENCSISYNNEGIYLTGGIIFLPPNETIMVFSSNNTILNCNVLNNANSIRILGLPSYHYSNNNTIYHNNFINNTVNAYDECTNFWDNGYPSGGNYWSDFDEPSEGAYDNNTDGIVDTPYAIPGGSNVDNYPFIEPSGWEQEPLIPHTPISINGNSQFTSANGVTSGNGTAGNPYIIENWDINASSAHGINIWNTDKYFVIRNCVVHDGKVNEEYGIYFYNVIHGTIDNITLYGNHHGIFLWQSSNNLITNCTFFDNLWYGIYLYSTPTNNTITNCVFYNNYWGIALYSSSNNIISNCTVYDSSYPYPYPRDISLEFSSNNTITNCVSYHNYYVSISIGAYSNNNTISDCIVYNNSYGIYLSRSSNNYIISCNLYNNSHAIYLDSSSNNNITNCNVYNNYEGIWLYSFSNNTTITNCHVYNTYDVGIYLYFASNNQITNSNVYNNSYGIELDYSPNNIISASQIYNNSYCGIYHYYSSNNKIHYNNIYDNTEYGSLNYNSEIEYQADTTYNWWGSANGPGQDDNNSVSGNVLYDPWLTEPYLLSVNIIQPEDGLITNQSITLVYTIHPLISTGEHIPVTVDGPANGTVYTNEGTYNVTITIIDERGNTAPATVSFTIDKTPPTITIEGVINGTFYNVSVIPAIEITDLNLNTSQITLNDAIFVSGTPVTEEGNYVLFVQATDKANNTATKTVSFTIDKTAPVIEITGVANNTYYNVSVTPVVGIIDINLNISIITLNGQSFTSGTTVTADGSYILVVQAIDKAGNTASKTVSFAVDKTLPEIVVTGIADNAYYNISVTPVVDITDLNLNTTSVMLNSEIFINGTTVANEGNYVLYAQATDKANNVATKTLSFTIDKTKPTINITGVTSGSYYNTDVIPIIDVSDANINITSITLNGNPFTSGNTISTENEYILVVQATDKAGNNATKTITFTMDKTPPTISNLIPAAGTKTTDDTIVISGKTEPEAVVKINGIAVSVSSDGSFSKGITLAKGENTITITATDIAGNTKTETITITKTEKEGGGKGFIPGFEAATLLIAVISIYIILLRKRKDL